jgi:hypothetical protein
MNGHRACTGSAGGGYPPSISASGEVEDANATNTASFPQMDYTSFPGDENAAYATFLVVPSAVVDTARDPSGGPIAQDLLDAAAAVAQVTRTATANTCAFLLPGPSPSPSPSPSTVPSTVPVPVPTPDSTPDADAGAGGGGDGNEDDGSASGVTASPVPSAVPGEAAASSPAPSEGPASTGPGAFDSPSLRGSGADSTVLSVLIGAAAGIAVAVALL